MSWASKNIWGSDKNPGKEANKQLDQIPEALRPYFEPYINQGREAGNKLNEQYNQMTQNPGDFFSQLSAGYKESPGYQARLHQALSAGNSAAAAGGMLGTPSHQQLSAETGADIASKDYEDYINHIMKIFGMGQEGQQGTQKQGYDASTRYGEDLGNVFGQKAQYDYAGTAGENQNRANNRSNLFKAAATAAAAVAGGPAGAAFANYMWPGQGGGSGGAPGANLPTPSFGGR